MTDTRAAEQLGLLQMLEAYRTTAIVVAAVRSGVLELLSPSPRSIEDIIETLGFHPGTGHRFLKALGALNFIDVHPDGTCELADMGRALWHDTALRLRERAELVGAEYAFSWFALHRSLVSGKSGHEEAYGSSVWEHRKADRAAARSFSRLMQLNAGHVLAALETFPFEDYQMVADVGGADGTTLLEILGRHPHLKGILIDREPNFFAPLDPGARVLVRDGDFFEDDMAELLRDADLVMLCHVLHDWPDDKARVLLERCRAAMVTDARILVVERTVAESISAVDALRDLHMMAVTGGQERTRQHFIDLFTSADLEIEKEGKMWMLLKKSKAS